MYDYYYATKPYTPPVYFCLPIQLLEGHYQQGWHIEDCEEAINDFIAFLIDFGADEFILKSHLADSHDNPQLWQLYIQVIGIDGATTGLVENAWLALLQVSDDLIFNDNQIIDKITDWHVWRYPKA